MYVGGPAGAARLAGGSVAASAAPGQAPGGCVGTTGDESSEDIGLRSCEPERNFPLIVLARGRDCNLLKLHHAFRQQQPGRVLQVLNECVAEDRADGAVYHAMVER